MTDGNRPLSRRRLLFTSASAAALALAGCLGDDDADDATDETDDEGDADDTDPDDDFGEDIDADIPAELSTSPEADHFVDLRGQDVVEIPTREGEDGEPDYVFDPPFVHVDEGTTIRWKNTDGAFHTVTSVDTLTDFDNEGAVFEADLETTGDEFEWTADDEAQQNYYCVPHATFMWGAILVGDAEPEEEDNGEDVEDYDWRADDGFQEQGDFVLPTDPVDDDFADWTGEDEVTIETHNRGAGLQTQFLFDPPFVRVDEGTTVRFVNTDGVFHTVTSTDSLNSRSGGGDEFDAVITAEGDEFVWEAGETGQQDYYCSPHAGHMYGSIDVV